MIIKARLTQHLKKLCMVVVICGATLAVTAQTNWLPPGFVNSYAYDDNAFSDELEPDIATDGNNNWLSVWRVTSSTGDPNESEVDPDFIFSHSIDPSVTWNFASELTLPKPASSNIQNAKIGYAGNSVWFLQWTNFEDGLFEYQFYLVTSVDNGTNWSVPVRINPLGLQQGESMFDYQIISDGEGTLIATGRHFKLGIGRTLHSTSFDFGQTWSEPKEPHILTGENYDSLYTKLAYIGNGKWALAYVLGTGYNDFYSVHVATSVDSGATWHPSGSLFETSIYNQQFPVEISGSGSSVIVAAKGSVVIRDSSQHFLGLVVCVSEDGGTTFTAPIPLTNYELFTFVQFNRNLSIAAAGNEHFAIADYYDDRYQTRTGRFQVWRPDDSMSTWTLSYETTPPYSVDYNHAIAGGGGKIVLVEQFRSNTGNLLDGDSDIRSISSDSGTDTWTDPVYVNPGAETDQVSIMDTDVAFRSDENIIMARWLANRRLMTARSIDDGLTWSEATEINSHPMSDVIYVASHDIWLAYGATHYAVSNDDGVTWSGGVQLSDANLSTTFPVRIKMQSSYDGTLVRLQSSEKFPGILDSLRSIDGGNSWVKHMHIPAVYVNDLQYTGSGQWLALTSMSQFGQNQLYYSGDDGRSWTASGEFLEPGSKFATDGQGKVMVVRSDFVGETSPDKYVLKNYSKTSSDHGLTWEPETLAYSHEQEFNGNYVWLQSENVPLWISEGRWVIFMRFVLSSREYVFSSDKVNDVRLYMIETFDNGLTWKPAELIHVVPSPYQSSYLYSSTIGYAKVGGNLLIGWPATEQTFNIPGIGTDSDIAYQVGVLGNPPPPPPVVEPPLPVVDPPAPPVVEPPGVDGPAANLTGAWAPAEGKCKTNKKGETKCSLKATFMAANVGDVKSEQKSIVRFYLSADDQPDINDVELKPKKLGKLKPGKGKSAKVKLNKLTVPLTGQYLIGVIDADAALPETNEGDNIVVSDPLP